TASITEAARAMRDRDIGTVVAVQDGEIRGILTDRDIVVRGLAAERPVEEVRVGDVCSATPATLTPDDPVDAAIRLVRERHVRRIPVVENGRPVGIVSIGDLAIERDRDSALAELSDAPPNA
ncbi:MAG: CBS domain-containing protein, partial [Solirubrobacteraceae bacterium]|nr:CBS domain-containing protein [Solirubrobacteraceae bacterium]